MKILSVSSAAIQEVLIALRGGGVIAHATETCYGLACDLTNPAAVRKLFRIKKRSADQPVSALFSSVEEAKKYVEWNNEAEKLAKEFLPGPLTLILRQRSDAPIIFIKPETRNQKPTTDLPTTIGIRISSHPLAQELVQRFGKPISTTSANIHGLPNTYSSREIIAQFHGQSAQPDLIIDSGDLPKNKPSRIVDLSQGEAKEVR
ncbi:MAG: L-threonylcarbamoyladenylate synthase [Candidatus Peribacteraceae bacterium]|nr:L-threonylcarbamoyladenylate synthase [Candidatus Peribacteraceae bacterium]